MSQTFFILNRTNRVMAQVVQFSLLVHLASHATNPNLIAGQARNLRTYQALVPDAMRYLA